MHIQYKLCIFKLFSNLSCVIDLFAIVLVLDLLSPWLRIKQATLTMLTIIAVSPYPLISQNCWKLCYCHYVVDALETDFLQIGFKDKIGNADAIFTLNSTIEHFVDRGSSVYISSLDISKAFDRVSHYKMYKSLLEAGVPVIIVDLLHHWYSKLSYALRWNGCISA